MAAPESATPTRALTLLDLPVEVRQMFYREVFSYRSIILRDHLYPPDAYVCGRRYWNFRLDNPQYTSDSSIPLLQVCKQVLAEAQPLLQKHTPSHLILSKELHELPRFSIIDLESKIGVPLKHITNLAFNVQSLGENKNPHRKCPGSPTSIPTTSQGLYSFTSHDFDQNDAPPPEPQRLANLDNINQLLSFFKALPALRELHIYDVLKYSLSRPPDSCTCPIARSESCSCGNCQCDCIIHPPLPRSETTSLAGTEIELHEALLSRFRTALPAYGFEYNTWCSNQYTVISLLGRGVHVFLHDEIRITVPLQTHCVLYKGLWRATFHLAPPENAKVPADSPIEVVEGPRQRKLRQEKEEKAKRKLRSGRVRERNNTDAEPARPVFDAFPSDDYHTFLNDNLNLVSDDGGLRDLPDGFIKKTLAEFKAGLHLEIADKAKFDKVVDRDIVKAWVEESCRKLWKWD